MKSFVTCSILIVFAFLSTSAFGFEMYDPNYVAERFNRIHPS